MFIKLLVDKSRSLVPKKLSCCYSKQLKADRTRAYNLKLLREMLRVSNKDDRTNLSLYVKVSDTGTEKEFNFSRAMDEPISQTFQKIAAKYQEVRAIKVKKKKPAQQMEVDSNEEKIDIGIFDEEGKRLSDETLNKDAWKENYTFKLHEQTFTVAMNLPSIQKIALPRVIIAGMPIIARVDSAHESKQEILTNSKYTWFHSIDFASQQQAKMSPSSQQTDAANLSPEQQKKTDAKAAAKAKNKLMQNASALKWQQFAETNSNVAMLPRDSGACLEQLVRVDCVPSDGKRQGLLVSAVSPNPVLVESLDLTEFPMTARHALTQEKRSGNDFRVMSYNILASCYSDTVVSKEQLYPYCPLEFLDFNYRRLLLAHEIKNFNADVIFLQECETPFLEDDLAAVMFPHYSLHFKGKSRESDTGRAQEGEAILFRKDRFKFIKSHDINLAEEMRTNPIFESLNKFLEMSVVMKTEIEERNTVLQVIQVESLEHPGHHLLLANTHLYFHPRADMIRLIQVIVCVKYLEKLKYKLESDSLKSIRILFGGDFNSDPPSKAVTYLFTQQIPELTDPEEKILMPAHATDHLMHTLNLSAYANFPFTNCIGSFESVLDYVFYETEGFDLTRVIPLPSVETCKANVALPSRFLPSDHLSIVFELKWK